MRKGFLVGLLIGVLLLGAAACISSANANPVASSEAQSLSNLDGNSQWSGIWVSGEGKITVVPDVAILTIGVEAQASTVQEAIDEAAVAMDQVIATLRANGVAEKDIETQWFNIYPVRSWIDGGYELLLGYRVTNMVTANIRDVEATGRIIDAVAQAGEDFIQIQGVSFTVDDPSQYYAEARAEAVADAKARAQQLADLAGVQLGKPFYISESGGFVPIYCDYRIAMSEGGLVPPTPISPGETEITLTVQMAFAIQ
ncbi:MAG: SIMPL domain-containing protein [Dehalococcoidia bacterium]|nr:SIMPL domain-containing protein [Dehalococcoidia bacterium]